MSEASFQERRDETRRFLELLWGNATRSGDLSMFIIPDYCALRLPSADLDAAAHEIAQAGLVENVHVYLNCCLLSEESRNKGGRGTAADALMIAGIWADVDIAGPAHKSEALPPDTEAALELCLGIGLPPTLVVHSGHGLYPWWLFDKPRRLADDDGRARAHRLVQGTQAALAAKATERDWQMDSTSDLARLLRPPGTINRKIGDDPLPVEIYAEGGPRYDPAQLIEAWGNHIPAPRALAEPLPDKIFAGQRTNSVASLAGTLRKRNVVEDAAMVAALEHNRLICEPPLPADKVRETVRGIYTRYAADGAPLAPPANGSTKSPRRGLLRPFSQITPVPMRFIWRPRIYQGYLTLLAGDPGMGKGLIAAALVGAITAGVAVPEGTVPSGSVLWVSYEESEASAIRPRLDAAGADPEKVFQFVMPQDDGSEDKRFRPADVPLLRELLASHPDIRLIVLDPIISYFGGDRDINQSNQVRDVLEPLTNMADAMGTGVLGIAHINKSELSKTLYRISNSGAFVQVARSVLGVGELKDGRRGLAHIKSSYSKRAVVIPYDTIGVPYPGFEETVGRVIWDTPDPEIDPLQIFESKTQQKNRGPTRAEECGKAIVALLADGPKFTTDIRMALRRQGFSDDAIDGGRDWAGVIRSGRGDKGRWHPPSSVDTHPELSTTESEDDRAESGAQLGGCAFEDPFETLPEEGDV